MESKRDRRFSVENLDPIFYLNTEYEYRIRNNDKITTSVWGQDELSVGSSYGIYNSNEVYGKWLIVDSEGTIELPKLGRMYVRGYTIPELKNALKKGYSRWINNSIVDVKVLNREITVIGEVRNPQVLTVYKDQNTLLEAISMSGGFDSYANVKHVKVLRQVGLHVKVANIDLSESGDYFFKNIQLHPGDVVVVPSKKNKEFDNRISNLIPFTSAITSIAILAGTLIR
ncbi:MAG: polysaccharide export outer membrane protein [Bacteroidia bacterium]|jgi:polysaccharide export outer membrane protein